MKNLSNNILSKIITHKQTEVMAAQALWSQDAL